jgi:surface polysaccharide O-acyltransferase-like enzyme
MENVSSALIPVPTGSLVKQKIRESNFELLRIISMFFVLTMHYFDLGGALHNAIPLSFSYDFSWFMEAAAIIGVNLFVMITGYYQCTSTFKLKKLIILWAEVIFYCVGIYLIMVFLHKVPFSFTALIHNAMPVSNKFYWFISCYIALYMISPFLNAGIKALTKKQHGILIIVLFALFYLWNLYLNSRFSHQVSGYPVINANGFSLTHFVFLYILAAYIRLY